MCARSTSFHTLEALKTAARNALVQSSRPINLAQIAIDADPSNRDRWLLRENYEPRQGRDR